MTRAAFLSLLGGGLCQAQSIRRYNPNRTTVRIPLVGPSNTSYSLAASASQSMNCYVESIEGGDGKNKYVLRGRPGMHLFADLNVLHTGASPVRGLWSGGGRLFVAANNNEFEVNSSGAIVGAVNSIASSVGNLPVTIIPNSNQLLIVSANTVYCDNGLGPVAVTFAALNGLCDTSGTQVILRGGSTNSFDVGMVGQTITINGTGYTVSSVTNPNLLTIASSAGAQTLVTWSCTPVLASAQAAFMDGYFIAPRVGTKQFNISGLLNGSSWNGLDFAIKEGYADNIAAAWAEPPLLYLLGTETLEVWRNTGNTSFPLERVDGGFARVGLAATWSPCSIMGKLHMLAGGTYGQTVAVRMEGTTPVRISTHAVEEALNANLIPNDGVSYSYVDRGHWFWVIHLKSGSASSWVYDATESARLGEPIWHERTRLNGSLVAPYAPRFHTFIPEWGTNGKHIVGDYASGKLYELSSDFFDDDGVDIKVVRALPYVYKDNKRIYHHRLEIEMETGTAATPPVVTLDWSDDRGQTFGTGAGGPGSTMTLGPGVSGTYTTRYVATGLGSSRGRVYRLTIKGQGKVAIIDAMLEATIGAA